MEVVEENELNVLREIVNDEELAQIPKELAKKIYSCFNAKYDEFITAKAVFESNRKNLGKRARIWTLYRLIYTINTLALLSLAKL